MMCVLFDYSMLYMTMMFSSCGPLMGHGYTGKKYVSFFLLIKTVGYHVVSPLKSLSTTDVTHVSSRRAGGINSNKQTLSESYEFVMIFVM